MPPVIGQEAKNLISQFQKAKMGLGYLSEAWKYNSSVYMIYLNIIKIKEILYTQVVKLTIRKKQIQE